jgi:hypothetical protein
MVIKERHYHITFKCGCAINLMAGDDFGKVAWAKPPCVQHESFKNFSPNVYPPLIFSDIKIHSSH